MKFIVAFHSDMQIVEVDSDCVNLLEFAGFTVEDWKNLPLDTVVKVLYTDGKTSAQKVWDASIIQVS
jgi:hypothetical protein